MVAVTVTATVEAAAVARPAMNVPRPVLDAFDGLVASEDKKRTAAAMLILRHVDQVLRGAGQGKEMPVGVKYIVQRLVTGLASTRLKAREGYFSALCFLLRLHPSSFTPSFIVSLLTNKRSVAMKAATKDEIRDQLVAELLLCGALIRSGHAGQSPEVLQRVVNQLCAMRTKKSYLDITATQFLVNLMESCEGDAMHEAVWQSLQAELQSPVEELSPSQLWMRLVMTRKHRASPPVWLTSTLAPKNHKALGQTLMKTAPDLPKVHPVLEELMSSLAASRDSRMMKFWQMSVEPLQGNTSPGKLQILFHLLRFMVPHLRRAAQFKEVVTSSIVGLLLNSLTQSVRDLKEAARGVTAAFVQLVKDNQDEAGEVQLAVVRALVTTPGSVRFDQLAGHKVLAMMVPHFTLKTLKGVAKTLLEVVNKPIKDLEVANRNYASHTLGNLLAQPRACTPEAATWKKKQLMALLKAALLTPGPVKEGDNTKDAFFKALGKQVGHIREYKGILLSLMEEVDRELKALEAAGSSSPLSVKGKEQWSRVNSSLAALKGKECEEGTEPDLAKTIFQVLYCQMALHLFVDVTAATESIEEFITCHKEVNKLGMLKGDEDEDEDEEDVEGRPNWVEVVTELLLSLMTQEMHLFRSVVQGLFWLLTPLMTATALSLLTDVLDTEKARELVKKEGDEEDDEDDDDDDDEEEKEGSDDDEDAEDSDDDGGDEEEGPGEDEDPNLFTLKKKMLAAAGGIDVDVDMDSVPQEELDRLDERLGALFAEYRGKQPTRKKKRKKGGGGGGSDDGPQLSADEQSLMHFQTKVCDMLIVYIKAAPNMALQVGLVNPVFKALRTADLDGRQKDLQNKLVNVITALEKKKKFNAIGEINVESWKEIVSEFFSFTCQLPERFLSVAKSCYSQLMHCGRFLLGMDEAALGRPDNFLTTTYITHLETFFTQNQHLPKVQPLCEPCTYSMGGLWRVAATLVRLAFDPQVKVHKQAQALKTLQQLYGNKALVGERSTPEAAAVEQDLCSKVVKALGSMQSPINGQFMSNLLSLLRTILQVDRRTDPQPSLAWEELRGSLEAFRERISKTALKAFRREYNVFTEALRGLLNSKKKQGVKREAGDLNKSGNQIKKRKKENINSLATTNNNNSPFSAETGGKEVKDKKKNKNKKNLVEKIDVNEDNKDTRNKKKASRKEKENGEITSKKIMVNGGDNNTLSPGQIQEEKKLKKKKKKDKLANSEDSVSTPNQEEKTEKKKKKKRDKLTDTPAIAEVSSEPQTQDNHIDKSKEEKKKKKNKLAEKRRQGQEEEQTSTTASSTSISLITPEPTPKKKKKRKSSMLENGEI